MSIEKITSKIVGDAEEKKPKYLERSRDITMRHVNGSTIRLLAIEDQHYIDYTMPFRNMQYDALEYQHQLDDIKSLWKSGTTAAKKLLKAIEASKQQDVSRLIYALGIRQVGEVAAEQIAGRFGTLEALFDAKTEMVI